MKLSLEEVATLLAPKSGGDNLSQFMLLNAILNKDEKKDEKKEAGGKPFHFLGLKITREKKESTGSLVVWTMLALMAFSPYVNIFQDWIERSLRAALQ
jgi:hypothetical protein